MMWFGATAQAGVVLSISPSIAVVEIPLVGVQSFDMDVQLAADNGTQAVQGYTIPVDLSPPIGTDAPVGLTVTSVQPITNFSNGTFFVSSTNPAEGDVSGSDATLGSPIVFSTTPTSLFRFTVQVDIIAIAGDYTASFVNDRLLVINDSTVTELPSSAVQSSGVATVRLVAVPEPTSLALVTACVGSIAWVTRRRWVGRRKASV